jgi:hypothetical protein
MRFLQRLANADLTQKLKERAFRRRDKGRALAALEGPNVHEHLGTLFE